MTAPMKKKKSKAPVVIWIIVILIAALYVAGVVYFRTHLLPGTQIDGLDCEYETTEEAYDDLLHISDNYVLTIYERGGGEEKITGNEIGLEADYPTSLDQIMEQQNPFSWPISFVANSIYTTNRNVTVDKNALAQAVASLQAANTDNMIAPEDAKIVYNEEESKFEMQDPIYGTTLDPNLLYQIVNKAIKSMRQDVDLDAIGAYQDPVLEADQDELKRNAEILNENTSFTITYNMLDAGDLAISKEEMASWITIDDDGTASIKGSAVREYVQGLAEQYDTRTSEHVFHTSWGCDVNVTNGTYGWELDQETEYEELVQEMTNKEDVYREPYWSYSAVSHLDPDYGDSYVEVNISRQHMYLYVDGEVIEDSDFVSGNTAKGRGTTPGIYNILYKDRNVTLKGQGYSSPVSYWMPFYNGMGLHDASWRGVFGGTIYKYSGSHGCINLPTSVAAYIYDYVEKGMPVFVYYMPGEEEASSTYAQNR